MSGPKNEGRAEGFLADCARIYLEWHERAQAVDTEGLLALYHKEAVLESPLVQAILDDKPDGVLRGHAELRHFLNREDDGGQITWCDGTAREIG